MAVSRTQRPGVAVIHIPDSVRAKTSFLVGSHDHVADAPVSVFDKCRMDFVADLSSALLANPTVRALPDVVAFAFWCRRANLAKIAANADTHRIRVGLGLVFHISPSNVPVNFAFSLVFGLLAGNSCVVRLPSRESASASVIVDEVSNLLKDPRHVLLIPFIHLIRFERDDEVSEFWLSTADGRVVWGGDSTVAHMRALKCRPRSREVAFPDRYSLCVIGPKKVLDVSAAALDTLCAQLYNDIYLMDQNACSSPQLLAWVGESSEIGAAKTKLWPVFASYVKSKYDLEPIHVMDKYVDACRNALCNENVIGVERYENSLYRIELDGLGAHQQGQRGYFGTIHEVSLASLNELAPIVNDRYQTLTYFGLEKEEIRNFVVSNQLRGIDRCIPIGRALEMDVIWDGYDVIANLSRIVDIQ